MVTIPKIFHRIWIAFKKENTEPNDLYKLFDQNLKKHHSDWQFEEWNETRIENFVKEQYPKFWPIYSSYDVVIKKHDAARYLILDYYGGVFIQHSMSALKNFSPLFENMTFVASYHNNWLIGNAFFASTAHHPILESIIKKMPLTARKHVFEATGPNFFTPMIESYIRSHKDDKSISVKNNKYIYPFDVGRKDEQVIHDMCYFADRCGEIFPEAYTYTLWKGEWIPIMY